MLWILLRSLGYILASIISGYDYARPDINDTCEHKLDPIQVAGCLRLDEVKRYGRQRHFKSLCKAWDMLDRPKVTPFLTPRITWTPRRYRHHFEQLKDFGILEPSSDQPLYTSGYFSIPKENGSARAIFNGSKLSTHFPPPPPVNIMSQRDILHKIAAHVFPDRDHSQAVEKVEPLPSAFYVIHGDFRHWFHQLPSESGLSRYFGVACAGIKYLWKTLPMGWSWSPYIAQAAAWTLIVRDCDDLLDLTPLEKDEGLPFFIRTKGHGFITVYYDNYIFVTSDEKEAVELNKRFLSNCRDWNAVIKEHQFLRISPGVTKNSSSDALFQESSIFRYLGLEIKLIPDNLLWRVSPNRVELLERTIPLVMSPRVLAQYIGKIISVRLLESQPLGASRSVCDVINLLRATIRIGSTKGWDSERITLSTTDFQVLSQEWDTFLQNPWRCSILPSFQWSKWITLATDASDWGWGMVLIDENGNVLKQYKKNWDDNERKLHIFIREMLAVERSLTKIQSMHNVNDCKINLVVDNTAVAAAVKRGYSSNDRAMHSLRSVILPLHHRLRIITVISEHNVADGPSRNKPYKQETLTHTVNAIKEYIEGRRVHTPHRAPFSGSLRHSETSEVAVDEDHEGCNDHSVFGEPQPEEEFLPLPKGDGEDNVTETE